MSCIVYKFDDLEKLINNEQDKHQEIISFYKEFNDEKVTNLEKLKDNTQFVFTNEINKSETKSTIIQLLNKLNKSNLQKIYTSIRDIKFSSNDELDDLIKQFIIKIKQESNMVRPLVGRLCKDLSSTFFIDKDGEKIHFIRLMLKATFTEYSSAMNFKSKDWDEEKAKKSIILLGTLMNSGVVDGEITEKIVEDFKKKIAFIEPNKVNNETYYSEVEKSMQLLSLLISMIVEKENKEIFINAKPFIDKELTKYEDIKCITRKTRIFFKEALNKLENDNIVDKN